jgi:hypothetical protein
MLRPAGRAVLAATSPTTSASLEQRTSPVSTDDPRLAHAGGVGEPEPGWRLGDQLLVELPDGQIVRCRIVNISDTGTIQVVPEHEVVIAHGPGEG